MKGRLWLGLVGVLAVAALIFAGLQPVFAFQALAAAGESGDRDRLATLVDFPALQADLKEQLSNRVQEAIDKDKGLANSPFGALGSLIGSSVVDQVVDAAVTPEGIAAIVRSGHAPLSDLSARKSALPPPPDTDAPAAPVSLTPTRKKPQFAYTGLSSFKATTFAKDGAPLGWVMGREGMEWRLVRIELPPSQ